MGTWLANTLASVLASVWDFYAMLAAPLAKVFSRVADDTGTAAALSAGDIALAAVGCFPIDSPDRFNGRRRRGRGP